MRIEAEDKIMFSVSRFTDKTIDEAKHPYELVPEEGIVLHIDMAQHGLGTGSCGPETLPQYSLYPEPFEFGVIFKPI